MVGGEEAYAIREKFGSSECLKVEVLVSHTHTQTLYVRFDNCEDISLNEIVIYIIPSKMKVLGNK